MINPKQLKFYNLRNFEEIPQLSRLSKDERFASKVVAHVLPFRTNNYVVEELINWDKVPDDPIFQLTFMQKDMLSEKNFDKMADAVIRNASKEEIRRIADEIRMELNPHPAGQMTANVPFLNDEEPVRGVQHKYRETALVFPSSGQTCHAYCSFCFRWAQFVGMNDLKFATDESKKFQLYLKQHKELTDVLFTGGDPMVMTAEKLKLYLEPLLSPEFSHIRHIRIGSKSIAYWPYRYFGDGDSSEILKLFEKIVKAGKHLAIMGHFNHWVESSTAAARQAIANIRSTGAQIRTQSPLIRHINDKSEIWARMWKDHVSQGMIPYYMFVERDTGAKRYFAVPLYRAFKIFREAYTQVSGLARTVRGPSMSATPGKVAIDGITEINGEKLFILSFLQGRNPEWVRRPFFAKYDEQAIWLNDLKPALGKIKFFFEDELNRMLKEKQEMMAAYKQRQEELAEEDAVFGAA